jgi:hypothetical protein
MARNRIFRKDGTPTPYFWSDKDSSALTAKKIYKRTADGVKRMKGVLFNAATKRVKKLS